MDTRRDTGFEYSMPKRNQIFLIGVAESAKKLKSGESNSPVENTETSSTGRQGMSTSSQEGSAEIQVKLGRHVSSNGGMGTDSPKKVMSVRLGWPFRKL